jgi:hypothetical protein
MTLNTAAEWERIGTHITADAAILHHTDGSPTDTLEEIDAMHRAKGWAGEGYEGLFSKATGKWEFRQGRPDDVQGAQAQGYNSHSVGYSVAGNYMTHLPEPACLDLIVQVFAAKCVRLKIKVSRIFGHRDVSHLTGNPDDATSCPGDALYAWIYAPNGLRARVSHYLPAELVDWRPH